MLIWRPKLGFVPELSPNIIHNINVFFPCKYVKQKFYASVELASEATLDQTEALTRDWAHMLVSHMNELYPLSCVAHIEVPGTA